MCTAHRIIPIEDCAPKIMLVDFTSINTCPFPELKKAGSVSNCYIHFIHDTDGFSLDVCLSSVCLSIKLSFFTVRALQPPLLTFAHYFFKIFESVLFEYQQDTNLVHLARANRRYGYKK